MKNFMTCHHKTIARRGAKAYMQCNIMRRTQKEPPMRAFERLIDMLIGPIARQFDTLPPSAAHNVMALL